MAGDAGKKEAARKERTAGLKSSEAEKRGGSGGGGIDLNADPDLSIELDHSPSRQATKTPRARDPPGVRDPSIELDDNPSRQATKTTKTPRARNPSGFPVGNRNRSRADPSSRTKKAPVLKGAPPMSFYHLKAGTTRIIYRLNPKFGKEFLHTVGPLYTADPDPLEPSIPFGGRGGARAGPVFKRASWSTQDKDSLAEVLAGFYGEPFTIRAWNAASVALERSPDSCRNHYRDHIVDIDARIAKALGEREKHHHREEEEEEEPPPREEHPRQRREESIASVQARKQPIIESLSEED